MPYANYKAVETNPWAVVTFAVLGLSVQEAKCIKGDRKFSERGLELLVCFLIIVFLIHIYMYGII